MVIPKAVRKQLGLAPGDVLRVTEDQGGIRLQPVTEESALRWEGGVLVHCGAWTGDGLDIVQRDREERIRRVSGLASDEL